MSSGGWWRWALVSPDGVASSWIVGVSASVNLPLHHKVQIFSSGTSSPGWSRKKGRKTVVGVVCHRLGWCLLGECLSRGACVTAGNFTEEGIHSCVAAIQHAGLSSHSVYLLQLCAWVVVVWCLTEQVTMAVVQSAGSRWWCTWWSKSCMSMKSVCDERVPILDDCSQLFRRSKL